MNKKLKTALHTIILLPLFADRSAQKPGKVGGQAIIEGVMMRGKRNVSWAIRKPSGEMVVERFPFTSIRKKYKLLNMPIVRGMINLYESLLLGYKALSRSAEVAIEEEVTAKQPSDTVKKKTGDGASSWGSFILALAVSMGLFMYLPMWIASQIVSKESIIAFNTLAGIIRIILFLIYLVAISLWSEMRRIFEYHGAEHKAIFTFEDSKSLSLDNMRPYTTLHPRCGTSFLLLVGIFSILLFSFIDAITIALFGPYQTILIRFLVHLLLMPIVAGSSYEALRLSDRHQHIPLVGALIAPGLWLQKITTRQPDDRQLEVAAEALKAAV